MDREQMKKAEDILNSHLEEKPVVPEKDDKKPVVEKKGEEGKPTEEKKPEVPQKLVIGGKEYTPEEAEARLSKLNELELIEKKHGDVRSIYKEFTKRSQELATLKEGKDGKPEEKITETKKVIDKIDDKVQEYDEEAQKIRKNAKDNLGLALSEDVKAALKEIETAKKELLDTKEELKKELSDVKEFRVKKEEDEEKVQIKKTNEDLTTFEKTFPFVKRNEVIDYMIEESKKGNVMTVEEAVKRKYLDEIIEFKVKKSSSNAPITDESKGGKPENQEEDKTISYSNDSNNLFKKAQKAFEESLAKIRN